MNPVSTQEERFLYRNSANFVSWYRHISQDQGLTSKITQRLKEVLDGFSHLQFVELGVQDRGLSVFLQSDNSNKPYSYPFDELSDGLRMLMALYTLLEYARSNDYTLCIDEPENFLALAEIQPWLVLLYDTCLDGQLQSLLISHHPE
ncbi:MAG: ATP-binding protein, partial [Caldilineaceae bacterium]|nr:ATP-binding protein [Caldilineaceae bacterium]